MGKKLGALFGVDGREGGGRLFHFPLVPHGFILLESGIIRGGVRAQWGSDPLPASLQG